MKVICIDNIFPPDWTWFKFTIGKTYEFAHIDGHGIIKDNVGRSYRILSWHLSPRFKPIEEHKEQQLNKILY